MFDTVTVQGAAASRRARTVVISASVVLHAAAIAALAIAAMWRMDKLGLDDPSAVRTPFALPAAAPPGGAAKKIDLKAAVIKKPVKDTVQPVPPDTTPTQAVAATTSSNATGDGPADGPGGDGPGTDPDARDSAGACLEPPCGPPADPPEEPKCKDGSKPPCKVKPVTVAPNIATALRTSGNEKIHAPDAVRVQMRHAGKDRLTGTFHVCIGASGGVTSARALRSTGYDAYDDEILATMRAWRYRPYSVDGAPQPFCHAVTIVYVMKE